MKKMQKMFTIAMWVITLPIRIVLLAGFIIIAPGFCDFASESDRSDFVSGIKGIIVGGLSHYID